MLRPEEIKQKALRRWNLGQVLRAWLGHEEIFPLTLPAGKPTARKLLSEFTKVRDWKSALESHCKCNTGYGYRIEYAEINHRQFGHQRLPKSIIFDSPDDLAAYIGKRGDLARFATTLKLICNQKPNLRNWVERYPLKALAQEANWPRLLAVCCYFEGHPRPWKYLRELDIPGVDTKFIERNKGLLAELLDVILPPEAINEEISGLAGFGFERRYGLKYDEPLIRFRWLDADLARRHNGLDDLTIPLSRFRTLNPSCRRVFITENKTNGLSFPLQSQSLVIFGLGYGVAALKETGWLADKEIYYWGDIDTHGFAILSQLRGYFPRIRSLLMDRKTLEHFRTLWGREDTGKRTTAELVTLTTDETTLYDLLRNDFFGKGIRLEQEHIAFDYLQTRLRNLR